MNVASENSKPVRTKNAAPLLPYLLAMDGLRALAVIAVLLYHAGQTWIPGGFLGVEMFFVISGYLITSLLLAEWNQHGRIDFKGFWLRRARRLFPALFVLLVAVVGWSVVFLPTEVAGLRGDVFSTAGYVNNWYQIFCHKSYFESVGRPSLLRHMWSLAVEEQFYLIWPLAFCLLMALLRPKFILLLILAAAASSSVWMALLFQPNADPSRIYYGTDTRAGGLLLGVTLAYLWPPGRKVTGAGTAILDAVGLTALVTLGICFACINEFEPFLYHGGFSLTGLATAALLAVAVHPRARLMPRIFSWSWLRWVGLRSYGIYLWHFPVFMLTRPQLDVTLDGAPLLLVRFVLTLGIAAISYRWIETPIRNDAISRAWKIWNESGAAEQRQLELRWAAKSLPFVALGLTLWVFLLRAQPPAPPAYLAAVKIPAAKVAATNVVKIATLKTNPAPVVKPPLIIVKTDNQVTAIGDSVMEGVADELKNAFGTNTIVDANQGRLPWNTPAIVKNLHAAGMIHSTVILHIGNNGFLSAAVFNQIMTELKGTRQIVVVNLKVPRQWESFNNRMLASEIINFPNAVLLDWRAASYGHPNIFWKDGIHVRPEGAKVYADLIAQAVHAQPLTASAGKGI